MSISGTGSVSKGSSGRVVQCGVLVLICAAASASVCDGEGSLHQTLMEEKLAGCQGGRKSYPGSRSKGKEHSVLEAVRLGHWESRAVFRSTRSILKARM